MCGTSVNVQPVISAQVIAASGSYTSNAITLSNPAGFFSVQLNITGDGTVKIEALCSNDGTNYVTAEGSTAIMTGKTAGNPLAAFTIPVCHSFKLKVTETGGANGVTVTATPAMS